MDLIKQLKSVPLLVLVILTLHISSIRSDETVIPQDLPPVTETPTPSAEQPKHDDHSHVAPAKPDPLKHVKDVGHIREHLKEQYGFNDEQANQYLKDLEDLHDLVPNYINPPSSIMQNEYDAQTQFFVMHDYDNNTKLDGLELLKSMTHYHDEHEEHHDGAERDNSETLVEFVDMILKDQDYNNDGYIDYPEYITYYSKFDQNAPPATEETAHAHQ